MMTLLKPRRRAPEKHENKCRIVSVPHRGNRRFAAGGMAAIGARPDPGPGGIRSAACQRPWRPDPAGWFGGGAEGVISTGVGGPTVRWRR